MIVGANRAQLDAWLGDMVTVLLVLRDAPPSAAAQQVRDYVENTRASGEKQYDADWHEVLVTPGGNVTPGERKAWFGDPEGWDYAVLKFDPAAARRRVRWQGPIQDLLFPAGGPSYFLIRRAFLR